MVPWIFALAVTLPAAADATSPAPAGPTAAAAPADLEDITRALGADVKAAEEAAPAPVQSAAGAAAFNPELSFVGDVAAAYFSDEPAQLGAHDPNHTGFTFRQLELGVRSNVDPYFRFESFIVFTGEGVEVEEAAASTTSLPANLQLRAGKFFTAFGRINNRHPHSWDFIDQPLVNGKFFGLHANGGVGIEPSVLLPLPWYTEVVAAAFEPDADAIEPFAVEDTEIKRFDRLMYMTAVKQFWDLGSDWGLGVGVSGLQGPGPMLGDRTHIGGVDVHLKYRPLSGDDDQSSVVLQGEWLGRRREVADVASRDSGGYVQLVYHVDRRWAAGLRAERLSAEDPFLELHAGEAADEHGHEAAEVPGDHARLREAVQLTFAPTEFSQIRLQQNRDRIPGRGEPVWGSFLNLEVAIGAHGAHPY